MSAIIGLVLLSAPGAVAAPDDPSGFKLTIASRVCDEYTDVMANRARNDIQESLKDLGKNTVYTVGQQVSPVVEEPNDPNCRPLDGWRFTLGDGYTKPPAPVGRQSFSVVTGNPSQTGTTGTVPLLDPQGGDTGASLEGAVTVTLTERQAERAVNSNSLWLQGGTPSDPQLDSVFPNEYAFAALRCVVDNLNGDNVEWVGFPNVAGVKAHHVFCYAYYINPRPGFGTVTIRKVVVPEAAPAADFTFDSDLTYDPSGSFGLNAGPATPVANRQKSFDRAESSAFGGPYVTTERPRENWALVSVECVSTVGGDSTFTYPARGAAVNLAAGDRVTCTFTNRPIVRRGLLVTKVTTGGVGGPFDFTLERLDDPGAFPPEENTVSTTAVDTPATVFDHPNDLDPGLYRVTEQLPDTPEDSAGAWEFVSVGCVEGLRGRGRTAGDDPYVDVELADTGGAGFNFADCQFANRFVPNGRILLQLTTLGGTGSAPFAVTAAGGTPEGARSPDPDPIIRTATTTEEGVPTPVEGGTIRGLELGDWATTTFAPTDPADGSGIWRFQSFTCQPVSTPTTVSTRLASLSAEQPEVACTAVYRLDPGTTVTIVKTAEGTTRGRSGPAILQLDCTDGTTATLSLPADDTGPVQLASPARIFDDNVSCTVTEPATGAADDATVEISAALQPADGTAIDRLPATFSVDRDVDSYTLRVIDRYVLPSPTPTPTSSLVPTLSPTPAPSPTEGSSLTTTVEPEATDPATDRDKELAATGGIPVAVPVLGVLLIALGGLLTRPGRRRQ